MFKLDQLPAEQIGEIVAVQKCELQARLTDMGLYPGKNVKLLYRAPFGGPLAIDIDGYTLSLRISEAKLITVQIKAAKRSLTPRSAISDAV